LGEQQGREEAAFWRALRVTLAGSMIPTFTMSTHSNLGGSEPMPLFSFFGLVGDDGSVTRRSLDLADRLLEGALDDLEADLLVVGEAGEVRPSPGRSLPGEGEAAAGRYLRLGGGRVADRASSTGASSP
jgi:hypothetical protein